jgi:molybdenum cofactor cytidylyltransferase
MVIMIVLGAQAERLRQEVSDLPLAIAVADRWERGMGATIHAGLAAITACAELDGVIITLCDQPLLTSDHLDALVAASAEFPLALIASAYGGTLGVPALFPRTLFPELMALPEVQGAKPILQRHASQAVRVLFPGGVLDIDTIDDYQHLLSEIRGE